VKKIFNIIAWLLAGIYLVLVLGFIENEYEHVQFRDLEVRIMDSLEIRFIDAERARLLVMQACPEITDMVMSQVNTNQLEEILLGENAVKDVQAYRTVDGTVVVEITQRKPVIRIQDRDHQDFYLDREGTVLTPDRMHAPHILLANGSIDGRYRKMENVLAGEDPDSQEGIMKGLLDLALIIESDPFWRSQIVQIYIDDNGEFELIPRVGSHIILFGTGNMIEEKFFKLRTLYEEGFSRNGWNQYEFINLKYDRQVICIKR
jgi:cell division protein FtsQ